ncbi:MAG: N-acetyltransferase family protein [Parvibaculum sp.]
MRHADSGRYQDVAGITQIYNDAVLHTTAIWNDTVVDENNRRAWIEERNAQGFPILIAVEGDDVLGYATFGPFRPHDGYRHTVENSIYVRSDQRRCGIAAALMSPLVATATKLGIHAMIAGIEAENMASIRLHKNFGFRKVGLLPEVGRKFDRWLDLVLMQKTLDQ